MRKIWLTLIPFLACTGCATVLEGNGGVVIRYGTEIFIGTETELAGENQKASAATECPSLVEWLFPASASSGEALPPDGE